MCEKSYETAQICENGHIITIRYNSEKHEQEHFCSKCGTKTFTECKYCHEPIKGSLVIKSRSLNLISGYYDDYASPYKIETKHYDEYFKMPYYCYNCGKPYPWTEALLTETSELIDLMSELTTEQKNELKKYIPNIIVEKSSTKSSAIKISKLLKPVEKSLVDALMSTLSGKVVESALSFLPW